MNSGRVHFIAIGGSAMHNLAIALHKKGYLVTGSDDEIFDPARSRLASYGLLPDAYGWFPDKIDTGIESVILGMHARADNPELVRASELGLKIYSYPEFLYKQSKDKLRVVIGGSHGKTTITAMILYVLHHLGMEYDYMVGAKLEGFDVMVRLTENAKVMVFEGDEYLTSALDLRPKFHLYKPDVALVSGIAWDHMNVFPTFEKYIDQFRIFMEMIPSDGALIYCSEDPVLNQLALSIKGNMSKLSYQVPPHHIKDAVTFLETPFGDFALEIFGRHNLMNLEGARLVCNQLGVSDNEFFESICSFKGASNRLECILDKPGFTMFRDFAHAPSKLKATIEAVKEQYPQRKLTACFELHTYSSLNKDFLSQYEGCMELADIGVVYFSPHALELKKLPMLSADAIKAMFGKKDLIVFSRPDSLIQFLKEQTWENSNLLMMSSGNYDGIDLRNFAQELAIE